MEAIKVEEPEITETREILHLYGHIQCDVIRSLDMVHTMLLTEEGIIIVDSYQKEEPLALLDMLCKLKDFMKEYIEEIELKRRLS